MKKWYFLLWSVMLKHSSHLKGFFCICGWNLLAKFLYIFVRWSIWSQTELIVWNGLTKFIFKSLNAQLQTILDVLQNHVYLTAYGNRILQMNAQRINQMHMWVLFESNSHFFLPKLCKIRLGNCFLLTHLLTYRSHCFHTLKLMQMKI